MEQVSKEGKLNLKRYTYRGWTGEVRKLGEKTEKNSVTVLGQLNVHMQKNQTGLLPHTVYKNQLKMDQ